jgi:hypothetical protein
MGKNYSEIMNTIQQFQKQTSNKNPEGVLVDMPKPTVLGSSGPFGFIGGGGIKVIKKGLDLIKSTVKSNRLNLQSAAQQSTRVKNTFANTSLQYLNRFKQSNPEAYAAVRGAAIGSAGAYVLSSIAHGIGKLSKKK